MSLNRVSQHIENASRDGTLTMSEVRQITSREDPALGRPTSIGTFFDRDEYQAVAGLRDRVRGGEITASAEASAALDSALRDGPDKRLEHILSGGPATKKYLRAGAITGGTLSGGFGAVMGLGLQGWKLMLIAGPVWGLAGAALGAVGGYLAGMVHGALDD